MKVSVVFSLVIAIIKLIHFDGAAGSHGMEKFPTNPNQALIAELLIVCDKDFTDYFKRDRQKIVEYWEMYIWEINLRFKTLKSVNIVFRITDLLTIMDQNDQPFVENAKATKNKTRLEEMLYKFDNWLYLQQKYISKFDIAILATRAAEPESVSYQHVSSACKVDEGSKQYISSAAIQFQDPWDRHCSVLEASLAQLLGAPWDKDTEGFDDCKTSRYLMNGLNDCGNKRYFFSRCSDFAITAYVQSQDANCLRAVDYQDKDLIGLHSTNPSSLQQQCAFISKSVNATVANEDTKCVMAKCFKKENGDLIFMKKFQPFDYSPCDENKSCFRGRCLNRGYCLRNLGTGKCVHSTARFASNDSPEVEGCQLFPTLLDQFMLLPVNRSQGVLLATPYSSLDASENDDKCLTVDKEAKLKYTKCSNGEQEKLRWHLIPVNQNDQFLLYHAFSRKCAYVDELNEVRINRMCDEHDKLMWWIFDEGYPLPNNIFTKWDKIVTDDGLDSNDTTTKDHSTFVTPAISLLLGVALGMGILCVLRRLRGRQISGQVIPPEDNSTVSFTKE